MTSRAWRGDDARRPPEGTGAPPDERRPTTDDMGDGVGGGGDGRVPAPAQAEQGRRVEPPHTPHPHPRTVAAQLRALWPTAPHRPHRWAYRRGGWRAWRRCRCQRRCRQPTPGAGTWRPVLAGLTGASPATTMAPPLASTGGAASPWRWGGSLARPTAPGSDAHYGRAGRSKSTCATGTGGGAWPPPQPLSSPPSSTLPAWRRPWYPSPSMTAERRRGWWGTTGWPPCRRIDGRGGECGGGAPAARPPAQTPPP